MQKELPVIYQQKVPANSSRYFSNLLDAAGATNPNDRAHARRLGALFGLNSENPTLRLGDWFS